MITQGEIWWADLPQPSASEPGYRRPVVVAQCDSFNRSRIRTIVCAPLTGNLRWADAPGDVLLDAAATGLSRTFVATVSQITALDREWLTDKAGELPKREFQLVLEGSDIVLGR